MIVLFSTKKKKGFTANKGNFLWVTGGHSSVDGCPLPLEATGRMRRLGRSPVPPGYRPQLSFQPIPPRALDPQGSGVGGHGEEQEQKVPGTSGQRDRAGPRARSLSTLR